MATGQTNPPPATNIQREEPDIPVDDEMVCLSSFSLDRQLRESMKEIWYSKKLSDFTIIADGEKFKTHKFLLNAHVNYFSKSPELLSQSTATLDLRPITLELALTFLYLGQVTISRRNLYDLATAAEFLGIDLLKKQCRYALLADSEVTVENCLAFWTAARDTGKKILGENAFQVALENFDDLQHEAEFTELPLDCIQEYLTHSGLKVNTQDERLSAAMAWINADKYRTQHLPTLLKMLPLRDMHVWHLKQVLHTPGVKKQTKAQAYLEQVLGELTGKTAPQEGPETLSMKTLPDSGEHEAHTTLGKAAMKPIHSAPCKPWLVALDENNEMWGISLQKDIQVFHFGNAGSITSIASDGTTLYMTEVTEVCTGTKARLGKKGIYNQEVYCPKRSLWRYNNRERTLEEIVSHISDQEWWEESDWSFLCSMNKKLYIVVCEKDRRMNVLGYDPLQNAETLTKLGSLQIYHSNTDPICCVIPKGEYIVIGTVICPQSGSGKRMLKYLHTLELYSVALQKTIRTLTLPRSSDHNIYSILHMTTQDKVILVAGDFTAVFDVNDLTEGHADKIMYSDKYTVPNTECIVALSSDRQYVVLLGGQPKKYSPKHHFYRAPVQSIISNTGQGWEKLESNHLLVKENTEIKFHEIVELPVDYAVPFLIQ